MFRNKKELEAGHTVVFLQPTDEESRTWLDFPSTDEAMYGLCEMFQETLKQRTDESDVTYDIEDVVTYFNSYQEVLIMVYDGEFEHYIPHDSDWVMEGLVKYGCKFGETPVANGVAGGDTEENWDNPDEMI